MLEPPKKLGSSNIPINIKYRMKNIIKLSIILLMFILFSGCKDEPVTDIEKIEKGLKEVVKEKGITKCSIVVMYGESTYTEYSNVSFSIDGGFVIVTDNSNSNTIEVRYNLLYLSKYFTDSKGIALYFANTHY